MEKYNGPERRRYPRLNANFIVSYRAKEPSSSFDLSQTKDVGQGGLLFTASKKIEPGTMLVMTVRFPFIPDKLELTGQVVKSQEKVKGLIYETHVQFKDSDQALIRKIGDFIRKEISK
jgi:hypothetical protein